MIDIPELYAACIMQYVRSLSGTVFTGPAYLLVKETRDHLNLYYDEETFREACSILEQEGILERHSHPGMMAYYRVEYSRFNSVFGKVSGSPRVRAYRLAKDLEDDRHYPVLESYHDLGPDWLLDALSTYDEDIVTELEGHQSHEESTLDVPASDRVVSRKDNADVAREIEQSIDSIRAEIQNSNEVGNALGDLKSVAIAELDDLKSDLQRPTIRSSNFLSRAKSTLNWLLKKCADTSATELIKHALNLIIGWLS